MKICLKYHKLIFLFEKLRSTFNSIFIIDENCLIFDINSVKTNKIKSIQKEDCDIPINDNVIKINAFKIKYFHPISPSFEFTQSEFFS